MAGKNGSTSYTAPAAVEEASAWQPPTSRQEGQDRQTAANEEDAKNQSSPERPPTMDTQRPSHDRKPRGMLDRSLQAQLGRQLRSIYSDVASEPVPERFIKLLEDLETLEAREKRR
jgi:hypothetical protein